ncbi:MAG: isocitrate lyase/phosphoenolpyruvate mutase family protein [Acetobacterales bacterium]
MTPPFRTQVTPCPRPTSARPFVPCSQVNAACTLRRRSTRCPPGPPPTSASRPGCWPARSRRWRSSAPRADNALNVRRTVEELETAGVAALTVEDTDLPPPWGEPGRARLIPLEEGVGKVRAALDARADPELVVVARTGAMGIAGTDECVKRARAYAGAGVDALFLTGMETKAQLEAVASAVDIPLMLAHAGEEIDDPDVLSAHRVRICLQPHIAFTAAARAIHDTLEALREGTSPADVPGVASGDLMKRLVRDADYRRWMKDYLAGG